MMTFAGQLGYAGMNQHGVANFTNALDNFRWRSGMPFYPLRRMMLGQRSVDHCIDLLRRHRSCSAANFVLCDGRRNIGDVEVRPDGIKVFDGEDANCRLHTNHYLTKEFAQFEDGTLPDSPQRLARFQELVHRNWGKINPEVLKELMADHQGDPAAVCRHGAQKMQSVSGYIAEPAKGIFHVRRGQGCTGIWTQYKV
jgi:isopenicillin-N N-acyltransferase like protein